MVDEEKDAQDIEGEGTRILKKRRRRQEVPSVNIESSKGMQNIELLEV